MTIFEATPTSLTRLPGSEYKGMVDDFLEKIASQAGRVSSLCWWSYRIAHHDCIACDVYGSKANLNMTITLSGKTALPSSPEGEPFDLVDATDANCLLSMLIERFQLNSVTPIVQGLEFKAEAHMEKTA